MKAGLSEALQVDPKCELSGSECKTRPCPKNARRKELAKRFVVGVAFINPRNQAIIEHYIIIREAVSHQVRPIDYTLI